MGSVEDTLTNWVEYDGDNLVKWDNQRADLIVISGNDRKAVDNALGKGAVDFMLNNVDKKQELDAIIKTYKFDKESVDKQTREIVNAAVNYVLDTEGEIGPLVDLQNEYNDVNKKGTIIGYMNNRLKIPDGILDYDKLFGLDRYVKQLTILNSISSENGHYGKIKDICEQNGVDTTSVAKGSVASALVTAQMDKVVKVDGVDSWLNEREIQTIDTNKTDDSEISIPDTGIKSLYLAVLVAVPGLFNSVVVNPKYDTMTISDGDIGDVNTIPTLREKIWEGLRKPDTTDRVEFFNNLATLFILTTHKLLLLKQEVLFSKHSYEETRFFALDMMLNFHGIGLTIDTVVVGSEDNVLAESIVIENDVITVFKSKFYKVGKYSLNKTYVEYKVQKARFLHYYNDKYEYENEKGDQWYSINFWKRVYRSNIKGAAFGFAALVKSVATFRSS